MRSVFNPNPTPPSLGGWCVSFPFLFKSANVGTRSGATKVVPRGIFPNAKITRGQDWTSEDDEDGGYGKVGTVMEITGWRDPKLKDAAKVRWEEGNCTKNYRLGYQGKVAVVFAIRIKT